MEKDFGDSVVTVIHARLGERAFGTAPGKAEIMLTLRSPGQEELEDLKERIISISHNHAVLHHGHRRLPAHDRCHNLYFCSGIEHGRGRWK